MQTDEGRAPLEQESMVWRLFHVDQCVFRSTRLSAHICSESCLWSVPSFNQENFFECLVQICGQSFLRLPAHVHEWNNGSRHCPVLLLSLHSAAAPAPAVPHYAVTTCPLKCTHQIFVNESSVNLFPHILIVSWQSYVVLCSLMGL